MTQEWTKYSLSEVCSFQRGLTYSRKDTVDFSDNVVLRATNIDLESGSLDFSELKYLREDFEVRENYKLRKGALLICLSSGSKAHLGKVALVDDDYNASFGGFIGQVIPRDKVDSKYLFYNLISAEYKAYIQGLTDGLNINNLKSTDLKAFQINLPPLTEQKRIVAILDQAFEAINQAQENIERNILNVEELWQSKLEEVFSQDGEGWEEKTLGSLCSIGDGNYSSKYPKASEFVEHGVPFLTATNLRLGTIVQNKMRYIPQELHDSLKKGHVQEGDLVVVVRGSSTGNNSIIPREYDGANLNSQLAFLRAEERMSPQFLYLTFNSPSVQRVVHQTISGAAQPQLPNNKLLTIKVKVAAIEEQERIVKMFSILQTNRDSLIKVLGTKRDVMIELKESLLQKAFSGELTEKEVAV